MRHEKSYAKVSQGEPEAASKPTEVTLYDIPLIINMAMGSTVMVTEM